MQNPALPGSASMPQIVARSTRTRARFLTFFGVVLVVALITLGAVSSLRDCEQVGARSIACSPMIWSYDEWSERLIVGGVHHYAQDGDEDIGGFMKAWDEEYQVSLVEFIEGTPSERAHYPYVTNFGLQYTLAKQLSLGEPEFAGAGLKIFSLLCGLAMALVAAGIAVFAEREFGRRSSVAIVMLFALSPLMILHAVNPYWMIFLSFLPFMAVLALYPKVQSDRQFLALGSLVGLLIMVKSLTGYEYLSSIAVGAALPILYFELTASGKFDWPTLRRVLVRGFILGGFTVAGFAAAAGLHIAKAAAFFGSFSKGLMTLTVPMSYSTWDSPTGMRADVDTSWGNALSVALDTFLLRNLPITMPLYGLLIGTLLIMLSRARWSPLRFWGRLDAAHRALIVTWLAAVPVSLSWVVLATRHSVPHAFINWILGYLFMNVFAAMLVGRNLALLNQAETDNHSPA